MSEEISTLRNNENDPEKDLPHIYDEFSALTDFILRRESADPTWNMLSEALGEVEDGISEIVNPLRYRAVRYRLYDYIEQKESDFFNLEEKLVSKGNSSLEYSYTKLIKDIQDKNQLKINKDLEVFSHLALLLPSQENFEKIENVLDTAIGLESDNRKKIKEKGVSPLTTVFPNFFSIEDTYNVLALSRASMVASLNLYKINSPEAKNRLKELFDTNKGRFEALASESTAFNNFEVESLGVNVSWTKFLSSQITPYILISMAMFPCGDMDNFDINLYKKKIDFFNSIDDVLEELLINHPALPDIINKLLNSYSPSDDLPGRLKTPVRLIKTCFNIPDDGIRYLDKNI